MTFIITYTGKRVKGPEKIRCSEGIDGRWDMVGVFDSRHSLTQQRGVSAGNIFLKSGYSQRHKVRAKWHNDGAKPHEVEEKRHKVGVKVV